MAGNQGHRVEWVSTFPFHYAAEEYMREAPTGYLPAGDTEVGDDVFGDDGRPGSGVGRGRKR